MTYRASQYFLFLSRHVHTSIFACALCMTSAASAQMLTGYDEPVSVAPAPRDDFFDAPDVTDVVAEPVVVVSARQPDARVEASPEFPVEPIKPISPPAPPQEEAVWRPMLSSYDDVAPNAPFDEPTAPAAEEARDTASVSDSPVDLQADSMQHDEQTQTITASGNVMMVQDGRILRADEVSYDLAADKVIAKGHVVLNEVNGDIHYSDEFELRDKMKNGAVQKLRTYLNDGSRFTAETGTRTNGNKITMRDASYTPCEPCKNDPERAPIWAIRAAKVTHDEEEKRVAYQHARFEAWGVPVAYVPYFSHPDGTVKRKSGFLAPMAGYKSDLGAFAGDSYYWDIAPDMDATVGLIAMTNESPLVHAELRKRWDDAYLNINGGATHSARTESSGGVSAEKPAELRGHFLADGLWNIDDKWRAGVNAEWASDDQYTRQYDFGELGFSGDDVLENELYAERFSGRNYAVARVLAFQDIRIGEDREDQPEVLPEVIASFKGEPGAVPLIKGSWGVDTSFLGLQRQGSEQDINRFSLQGSWKRRLVSDYGLLTKVQATVRGDAYNIRDKSAATAALGQPESSSESRFFSSANIQSSYPMSKQFETMQATIEPIVALRVSPKLKVNNDIPNEDSQDVQIDSSNIFEPNRFPGLDRIEDQSKITYGLRTGLYGHGGSHADVFIGQSYRFDENNNPFPAGSGLDTQESDVVGQISTLYDDKYSLNYRFQLSSRDLTSERHEIDAYANWRKFQLSSRYLFAKGLEGTDIGESREQISGTAAYYVAEDWRIHAGARQDLGADAGLRTAYLGLDYYGQCVSFSLTGQRNYTDDASGDSNTEVLFRIGLKNIGEFAASGLRPEGTTE